MAKVNAFNNTTGERQLVPEHWLSNGNPAFDRFTKEPRKKAAPAKPQIIEPAKPENKEETP